MTEPEDYVDFLKGTSRVTWVAGVPWQLAGPALHPVLMPHRSRVVDRHQIRRALAATGAAYAQWTDGWDTAPGDWWYVCCDDRDYDLDRLSKGARYDTRRGLDACDIRLVDPQWFAQNGYAVYAAAHDRYGIRPPLSEAGFAEEFTRLARYPGRETWGAFLGGRLVAWESCIVVGDASFSSSAKADPAYLKSRPNTALVFVLTRHYVRDRGVKYHSAGARVLVHKTNVQEFQEKMGYRKVYCSLRVEAGTRGRFIAALRPQTWPRDLVPGRLRGAVDGLAAFGHLWEIARTSHAEEQVTRDHRA